MLSLLLRVAGIGDGLFVLFFFVALSVLICCIGIRAEDPQTKRSVEEEGRRRYTTHFEAAKNTKRRNRSSGTENVCPRVCYLQLSMNCLIRLSNLSSFSALHLVPPPFLVVYSWVPLLCFCLSYSC